MTDIFPSLLLPVKNFNLPFLNSSATTLDLSQTNSSNTGLPTLGVAMFSGTAAATWTLPSIQGASTSGSYVGYKPYDDGSMLIVINNTNYSITLKAYYNGGSGSAKVADNFNGAASPSSPPATLVLAGGSVTTLIVQQYNTVSGSVTYGSWWVSSVNNTQTAANSSGNVTLGSGTAGASVNILGSVTQQPSISAPTATYTGTSAALSVGDLSSGWIFSNGSAALTMSLPTGASIINGLFQGSSGTAPANLVGSTLKVFIKNAASTAVTLQSNGGSDANLTTYNINTGGVWVAGAITIAATSNDTVLIVLATTTTIKVYG